jgi:hypothetical protein
MGEPVDEAVIRDALPGTWRIGATNFPMWVNGSRRDPQFEYGLRRSEPLAIDDRVHYRDDKGNSRTIPGVDRWKGDHFVWRGVGVMALLRSRWSVAWLGDDVLVIHFEKSRVTPAGTDVATRVGTDHPELRSRIASDPARFGLTVPQFASLTWLDHIPSL